MSDITVSVRMEKWVREPEKHLALFRSKFADIKTSNRFDVLKESSQETVHVEPTVKSLTKKNLQKNTFKINKVMLLMCHGTDCNELLRDELVNKYDACGIVIDASIG